ncbi:ComF family protein [Fulvimarina sp. 2208YS6-2-32]|uniref:ComF family protein n=1 Tax=Fulvimarina uroteuthidis TaxID=3098149 RepID=A0ABU5I8G1_9HYPH|nr:ComF family protein [Fulvimarina sp. 2208YS6-2-32]MDY8110541.1 ComF family protein [Fulvimarina sp. 2208YS6-2-32]
MIETFATPFRSLGRIASDLLFPPICTGCGVGVSQPGGLCPSCWTELRFIERPFCDVLCTPFSFDPGDGTVSADAIADPPPFERLRAVVLYDDRARRLVSALKYSDRLDLVPLMAAWMARAGRDLLDEADVIVPVPLHRMRLWRRQFNQAAELGRRIAAARGLPFAASALVRVKATRSQVGLRRSQRQSNVRGAFRLSPAGGAAIAGRRVLLVDDVFTTGATASSATKALKRAGAASVDVLTFARVAAFEG